MEDDFSIFKQHYIEILLYVKMNQPCNKNEIYECLDGSSTTRIKHVKELIEAGMLVENKKGRYNIKEISLTDKGDMMLRKMMELKAIMNGEVMPDERNHGTPSAVDAKVEGE